MARLFELLGIESAGLEIDNRREKPRRLERLGVRRFGIPIIHLGRGLDDGAKNRSVFVLHGGRAQEHGLEQDIGLSIEEICRNPVEELHRCAERDIGLFDTAFEDRLIGAAEDVEPEPQLCQNRRKEGNEPFERKLFAHGDERCAIVFGQVGDELFDALIASAEGIGRAIGEFDAPGALIIERASAAPCKARFLALEARQDAIDAAFVARAAATLIRGTNKRIFFEDFGSQKPRHIERGQIGVVLDFVSARQ